MSQPWASRSIAVFSFLALLLPLSASPAPRTSDPCKQMHRELDRQIDDVKAQQREELNQCENSNSGNSDVCRDLKDQQQQALRAMRDDRRGRVAGCNGGTVLVLSATPLAGSNNFYDLNRGNCFEYPYVNCQQQDYYAHVKHHPHHHPPHHPPAPAPAPGPGGAGTLAAGDKGKPASGNKQEPSGHKPGTDISTTKSTGAPGSSSPDHAHNRGGSGGGSGSYSGSSRSADNGSSSHSGSSYSGSSSSGSSSSGSSSAQPSHSSSSSGGGSSYSGSSAPSSGSSYSAPSSPSPAQNSGSSSHASGAGTPK